MRIAIVADSFPPLKNSAAVLVFSLAEVFASEGHHVLVVTPSTEIEKNDIEDDYGTFRVLRIRCGGIKSHHKFLRGISELNLFFLLPYHFNKTQYGDESWDLVIWYSPTIFLGGLVKSLKKKTYFSYLILRDIVPDWMLDIGLMKKGFSFYLLKWFEHYQYRLADFIGIQSPGNRKYIENLLLPNLKSLEVLPNWMPSISKVHHFVEDKNSYTNLQKTILAGRTILIYAGNLGEAQGVENLAQVVLSQRDRLDCGFLIIGRGSKKEWLHNFIKTHNLDNALLLDEVDLVTLSRYYRQSHCGLVFLDPNHKSHNIPGKFISYLEAGLPVAACVNSGNDLIKIIVQNRLGMVADNLRQFSNDLNSVIISTNDKASYSVRARTYYENNYQPTAIASQIIKTVTHVELAKSIDKR
jgi:glycosyltransferase involved in cell wall biosynthesis